VKHGLSVVKSGCGCIGADGISIKGVSRTERDGLTRHVKYALSVVKSGYGCMDAYGMSIKGAYQQSNKQHDRAFP
jgi:hypothetical protein